MRIALAAGVAAGITALLALAGGPGDATARPACAPTETRAALASFVAAHNRGDSERLDSLFAEEPEFEWYSTSAPGERLGQGARRRGSLIPYFERRHAAGDRFDLRSFGFNGNAAGHGGAYGNFEMRLRRRVPGFRDGDWLRSWGKGAAICGGAGDSVRLIVISLGTLPAG
jgi:hypothetical protein